MRYRLAAQYMDRQLVTVAIACPVLCSAIVTSSSHVLRTHRSVSPVGAPGGSLPAVVFQTRMINLPAL